MNNNSFYFSTREQAVKKAEDASKRANLQQHALKLLQGFDKLDEAAARKAPWELVQNACDLTSTCYVTVDFRNDALAFSHNGQPFTVRTLLALIKQVSGEKRAGQELASIDDKPPVGQFGTGFITTHSFGRTIVLNSTLVLDEGDMPESIALTDFCIDRSTDALDDAGKLEDLISKLYEQEEEVYRRIRETELLTEPDITTTFCYQPATDTERRKISLALEGLRLYTPYVLALNDTLHGVTLVDADGIRTSYEKGGWLEQTGYWQMQVTIGEQNLIVPCLRSADGNIHVILPLVEGEEAIEPDAHLARLFLYFPLVGTEQWGCNFLIHAKQFAPAEARDGLHLNPTIESVSKKAEQNRQLLREASEMVFDFLEHSAERIKHPIHLARIYFSSRQADEETDGQHFPDVLQRLWVERFRNLQLVDTPVGRHTVATCWFLHPELLEDKAVLPAIHSVATQLWQHQLPVEELTVEWTNILKEWQDDNVRWISAKDLAERLAEHGTLEGLEPEALQRLYAYLLQQGKAQLFDDHALLPASNGDFRLREQVKLPENLAAGHLAALQGILPEVVAGFIQPTFAGLDMALESYGRSKLERDVNDKTKKLREESGTASEQVLAGLLALNSIFPSLVSGVAAPSTRRKLLPAMRSFYSLPLPEEIVPNIEDDKIDHESTPFKTLLKVFLGDVERKYTADSAWAAGALPLLLECLEVLAPIAQVKDEVKAAALFPNQHHKLCKPVGMLVEQDFCPAGGIPERDALRLKEIYENITGIDIRERLVHPDFERVLSYFEPEKLTGRELASKAEASLNEQSLEEISSHSKKNDILSIIQLIADHPDTQWGSFFPVINERRANIVLAMVQNPRSKNDLFNIIRLGEDKIEELAKWAQEEDFESIVALGRKALLENARKSSDFEFKKKIGVMIEDVVRTRIQQEMAGLPVEVQECQGGQDIKVLLDGQTVYRLEVKSRWQTGYSTTLSHLQSEVAAENKTRYALCCVDLTEYFPEGEDKRHDVTSAKQIENLIRFLPDIGGRVDELTAKVRVAGKTLEAVRLAEEYRVLVPQDIVQKGMNLSDFIVFLRKLLTEPAAPGMLEFVGPLSLRKEGYGFVDKVLVPAHFITKHNWKTGQQLKGIAVLQFGESKSRNGWEAERAEAVTG